MFNSQNYCENLLYMMDKLNEPNYVPDARLVKIMDKLFILMAGN
jgi:citrate synthase